MKDSALRRITAWKSKPFKTLKHYARLRTRNVFNLLQICGILLYVNASTLIRSSNNYTVLNALMLALLQEPWKYQQRD